MYRRQFASLVALVTLAGCGSSFDEERGRLDLTVQNERSDPISAQVTVVDEDGTTYEDDSDRIDSGVARSFEVVVGTAGRHEVTVSGADWRGRIAWHADVCAQFAGTVRVTADAVEVAGECVDVR